MRICKNIRIPISPEKSWFLYPCTRVVIISTILNFLNFIFKIFIHNIQTD